MKKKPKSWEKEFEKLDYIFHCVDDGRFCWGDKRPIYQEDTGGKRIVGYEKGKCFCGGEAKKQKVKAFIRSLFQQARQEGIEELRREIKAGNFHGHDLKDGWGRFISETELLNYLSELKKKEGK